MIVSEDGYIAFQDKDRIIVSMPQTEEDVRSTALPVGKRKKDMESAGLMLVLNVVKYLMEN